MGAMKKEATKIKAVNFLLTENTIRRSLPIEDVDFCIEQKLTYKNFGVIGASFDFNVA
jgi:hypothetical protein